MRTLEVGGQPTVFPKERYPIMSPLTSQAPNQGLGPTADADGQYTFGDGIPRFIRKGDPLPPGAVYVPEGQSVAQAAREAQTLTATPGEVGENDATDGESAEDVADPETGAAKDAEDARKGKKNKKGEGETSAAGPTENTRAAGPTESPDAVGPTETT